MDELILDLVSQYDQGKIKPPKLDLNGYEFDPKNIKMDGPAELGSVSITVTTWYRYDQTKQEIHSLPDGRLIVVAHEISSGDKHIFLAKSMSTDEIMRFKTFNDLVLLKIEKNVPSTPAS